LMLVMVPEATFTVTGWSGRTLSDLFAGLTATTAGPGAAEDGDVVGVPLEELGCPDALVLPDPEGDEASPDEHAVPSRATAHKATTTRRSRNIPRSTRAPLMTDVSPGQANPPAARGW
jgi:hypothetical protein